MYSSINFSEKVHRLIPSKFPPISLFDWADSPEELEQIALLEGLTNERILAELGKINLVAKEDWVTGSGATPLMAAFTHIGFASRFSDGSFGIYYAGSSLEVAIKETMFHRERFYSASKEAPCSISMREYIATVRKPLIDITHKEYKELLNPNPEYYNRSQQFGRTIYEEKHWGLLYPSVRSLNGLCIAILRPPALTIPIQGCHLKYIWNGERIAEIYKESRVKIGNASCT